VTQVIATIIPLAYLLGGYIVGMRAVTFLPTFLPVFALCALVAVQDLNRWYEATIGVELEVEETQY